MSKKTNNLELLFDLGIDEKSKTLIVNGEVNDEMLHLIETGLSYLEKLNGEEITIRLNSSGGDVASGLSIIDRIAKSSCFINIHASGQICSMAILILASGDYRTAHSLTQFMHHEESYDSSGRHSQNKNFIKFSEKFDDMLCQWLETRTKKDSKFWKNTGVALDHWFTSKEALSYGLIDAIVDFPKKDDKQ
jgi:ATP-dependent protease ClpP protease subunit